MHRNLVILMIVALAVVLAAPTANAHEGVGWVVRCVERFIGSGGAYC